MANLALVADIGGTNTRVALASGGIVDAGSVRRYKNAEMGQFGAILRQFLLESDIARGSLSGACVAGAGPVQDGVVTLTNLDWRVGPADLKAALETNRTAVLNDLQAQGHAIGHAAPDEQHWIVNQPASPQSATKLVVGIGTGFNAAPVFETAAGRLVMPSEAGHITLQATGPDALKVTAYLQDICGFAAVEEALSGRGLSQVDAGLHGTGRAAPELMAALSAGEPSAERTLRTVVQFLGGVVGDLALITLPFGGITLVGGVARHLAPWLAPLGFVEAMRDKGRFGPFLAQFGVCVVTDDFAALTGCAVHLAEIG